MSLKKACFKCYSFVKTSQKIPGVSTHNVMCMSVKNHQIELTCLRFCQKQLPLTQRRFQFIGSYHKRCFNLETFPFFHFAKLTKNMFKSEIKTAKLVVVLIQL